MFSFRGWGNHRTRPLLGYPINSEFHLHAHDMCRITNFDWTPTHSLESDLKLWWPHGETLYALLLAWDLTGREDLAAWYEKVHDYTFSHFPDPEYGEWFGYLNRDGSRVWSAKANGWKGFFHLPRILYRAYQLLDQGIHTLTDLKEPTQ